MEWCHVLHELGFLNQYCNIYLNTLDYKNSKLSQLGVIKVFHLHSKDTQPLFNQLCIRKCTSEAHGMKSCAP